MVDCRSLIEFCRAFERHRNTASIRSSDQRSRPGGSGSKRCKSLNPLFHPFCEHSPFAAIDVVMVILVIGALAVLTIPYFNSILRAASEFFPEDIDFVGDVIYQPIVAYSAASVLLVAAAIASWEVISHQLRKCGNPFCRGLRKAVEFDIQLEPEECVKYLPTALKDEISTRQLELGEDHKELEAELKKMAPPNGRTVLIFRAPCGCPEGRMEVWGPKKIRRIKK